MRFGTVIACMCMGVAVGCVPSEDGSGGDGHGGGQDSCTEDGCGSNTARGIGAEGGVVSHRSGVNLAVPAGALSEHVELSVEEIIDRASLAALPEGFDYISGAFAFLPYGQSFSVPVEVLLPFSSFPDVSETRVVRLDDRSDTEWETVEGASITEEEATFSFDRLGVYAVVSGEAPAPDPWPDCQYPVGPAAPAHNEVIPNLSWDIAYKEDGVPIAFSMREVYCSEEYADVETILFFATADWCPSCPFYMEYIRDLIDAFMEANTLIVWIEVEDRNYNIASSSHALEHVNRIIGDTPGIRVG
ncbi:MAG: hypothetical protein AAFX99_15270, partial [Myxococcota bacterium]